MNAEGELRDSGPVERSWKTLARVPTKRVPGMLAAPVVEPLLSDLVNEVMRPPTLMYVTSHTVFVSICHYYERGGNFRTCNIADHHGKCSKNVVFPNTCIILERLWQILKVCLERERYLPNRKYRPRVAEDIVCSFDPDGGNDFSIRSAFYVFHKVTQEGFTFFKILVEVDHMGFGIVVGEVPTDVYPRAIAGANKGDQSNWTS